MDRGGIYKNEQFKLKENQNGPSVSERRAGKTWVISGENIGKATSKWTKPNPDSPHPSQAPSIFFQYILE